MFLDQLALMVKAACIPGSHRTVAIGELVLGRLQSPQHYADGRLRHTFQSFYEGDL